MKNLKKLPNIIHNCMTIGELPSSYKISLSYEEQLLWFCNFLENEVIPVVNNNSQVTEELKHYLENLDVQEEINNKLEEMAESGQLADIIAQYIQLRGLLCYNSVDEMKNAENLVNGSFAKTYGFNNNKDGGGAFYKIRNITNQDIVDEATLIALNNENLVAEIVTDGTINLKQLGAYGDKIHDDTNIFNIALTKFNDIYIPNGNYLISDTLLISNGKVIHGQDRSRTIIYYDGEETAIQIKYKAYGTLQLKNFSLFKNNLSAYDENDTTSHGIDIIYNDDLDKKVSNLYINNIVIRYFYIAFYSPTSNAYLDSELSDTLLEKCYYGLNIVGGFSNHFVNCQFNGNHYGIRQRSGEGNFLNCLIQSNVIGAQVENPAGKFSFINCFFENTTTNDENIILLNTRYNTDQQDMSLISIINCHFYGAYNQMYFTHLKKAVVTGNTFRNFGNKFLNYNSLDSVAENWNFMGNIIDSLPSNFNTLPFINNIDEAVKDTGWVDIDTSSIENVTFTNFQMRRVGKVVRWRGSITNFSSSDIGQVLAEEIIPDEFRPDISMDIISGLRDGSSFKDLAILRLYNNGNLQLRGLSNENATIISLDSISYFSL